MGAQADPGADGSDIVKDVNSDQQLGGLQTNVTIDRDTAMRLGLTLSAIDNTLYDAFGQRQVSTIYNPLNQYHVVMEVAPRYWQDPHTLDELYVSTSGANPTGVQQTGLAAGDYASSTGAQSTAATIAADSARNLATNALAASGHSVASSGAAVSTSLETMVPLSAFAHFSPGHTPLSVNHQGQFAASTISFNLASGRSLSEAKTEIDNAVQRIGMPSTVRGAFAGTAATYQQSQSSMPLLFGAALVTIYIVLGVLYESLIHPITILSTLFSASVGAALALWLFDTQFTVIAAIGVLLLIGIVKKNAIMMVDFALEAERAGLDTREAIEQACLMRFRPIMMTTFAALFGALPLAFGTGEGSELRHPLGITIVGGLIVSQALTLYTTPVVFIYLDELGKVASRDVEPVLFAPRRASHGSRALTRVRYPGRAYRRAISAAARASAIDIAPLFAARATLTALDQRRRTADVGQVAQFVGETIAHRRLRIVIREGHRLHERHDRPWQVRTASQTISVKKMLGVSRRMRGERGERRQKRRLLARERLDKRSRNLPNPRRAGCPAVDRSRDTMSSPSSSFRAGRLIVT